MLKSNGELKKIIIEKGPYGDAENERIFHKFFENWPRENSYVYQRFDMDFDMEILDIGCNFGHNLIHFHPDSVGIEANPFSIKFAQALGLNIVDINAENGMDAIRRQFDLVWCTDFLVHMISPYKFLYDSRKLLKPGGKLVIQIPLMSFFNMHRSYCHFYAFNRKALLYILEMAGFKVLKTSGLIRKRPRWFNAMFEPILQIWGGNIWVYAEKMDEVPINFDKVYLPDWFKR